MKRGTILKEIEFELECDHKQALAIYNEYRKSGQIDLLVYNLKYHKEIQYGIRSIQ